MIGGSPRLSKSFRVCLAAALTITWTKASRYATHSTWEEGLEGVNERSKQRSISCVTRSGHPTVRSKVQRPQFMSGSCFRVTGRLKPSLIDAVVRLI